MAWQPSTALTLRSLVHAVHAAHATHAAAAHARSAAVLVVLESTVKGLWKVIVFKAHPNQCKERELCRMHRDPMALARALTLKQQTFGSSAWQHVMPIPPRQAPVAKASASEAAPGAPPQ